MALISLRQGIETMSGWVSTMLMLEVGGAVHRPANLRVVNINKRISGPRSEMLLRGKSVRSWCDGSSGRSFMVDPLSYFLFQPVLHDWCNKGCGMCYPVCRMVHIKEPLLLIRKSSLCDGSRFPFSQSEWSLTICLTPYNHK